MENKEIKTIDLGSETLKQDLIDILTYYNLSKQLDEHDNFEDDDEQLIKEYIHEELISLVNDIQIKGNFSYSNYYDEYFNYEDGELTSEVLQPSGRIQPAYIDHYHNQYWYLKGKLHRDDDLPAVMYDNGDVAYYKNGLKHRDNDENGNPQPAVIYVNEGGYKLYYKNGIEFFVK